MYNMSGCVLANNKVIMYMMEGGIILGLDFVIRVEYHTRESRGVALPIHNGNKFNSMRRIYFPNWGNIKHSIIYK